MATSAPTQHPMIGRPFRHYTAAGKLLAIEWITGVEDVPGSDLVKLAGPRAYHGRVLCIGPTHRRLWWQGWFHCCHATPGELEAGVRDDRPPQAR